MLESQATFGGPVPSRQLYPLLADCCTKASTIDLAVSFIKTSGLSLLLPLFKEAGSRGVHIRIVCGDYLHITEPEALLILHKELAGIVDIHFYRSEHRSFHPKCWRFQIDQKDWILIGSSNVSRSALTSGIEWNYFFSQDQDARCVNQIRNEFEQLWKQSALLDDELIETYRSTWIRPVLVGQKSLDPDLEQESAPSGLIVPNGIQTEALYALEKTRQKGNEKALIKAATGIGKTYLAAFDSKDYPHVLFVAHREEILSQAAKAFHAIRPENSIGFVAGSTLEIDKDLVFASVATLGKEKYLNEKFVKPDRFEYIIIDEFHHASANQYRKILDYFRPRFLLGLSATLFRLDGKNIYQLCDYNVPYEIDLFQAINRGVLCPFHYYGIYDETDYSSLRFVHRTYQTEELDRIYLDNEKRTKTILRHYRKYPSRRAIAFCASKNHARFMAEYFFAHGVKAASVVSECDPAIHPTDLERQEAIRQLSDQKLNVLFTVDMFNEGVDVPDLDQVLFLRPTDSSVIFLQQLGRGLRKAPDKDYLNVLDFIGNYKSARLGPSLLLGNYELTEGGHVAATSLPPSCFVDFDLQLIDLFEEMKNSSLSARERILKIFMEVCQEQEDVPSRMELYQALDEDQIRLFYAQGSSNPFRNYLSFLAGQQMLPKSKRALLDGRAGEFLHLLETTSMSRVYKMPLLLAFVDGNRILPEVSEERALSVWKSFFAKGDRYKDLGVSARAEFEKISDVRHLSNIKNNPARFLIRSGKGFFESREGSPIALCDELKPWLDNSDFVFEFQDIIEQRFTDYYDRRFENRKGSSDSFSA